MIRVLAVDDHDFFRGVLVDVLNSSPDLEVVGQCADGSEVLAVARAVHPDVVLMDVRMSGMSGLEAAAALQRDQLPCRVLMLTSETAPAVLLAARATGAAGYLIKGGNPCLLCDAIRRVAGGGHAWPEGREDAAVLL